MAELAGAVVVVGVLVVLVASVVVVAWVVVVRGVVVLGGVVAGGSVDDAVVTAIDSDVVVTGVALESLLQAEIASSDRAAATANSATRPVIELSVRRW